jgi:hypothetical protein
MHGAPAQHDVDHWQQQLDRVRIVSQDVDGTLGGQHSDNTATAVAMTGLLPGGRT